MPTLQQLRYLFAVADQLHFRRAAEDCHVTQPTLSAQVKELEARLGTILIERSRSRVILTPTGARVADHARRILRDVEELRAVAREGRDPLSQVVRVGVVQSLGSYFLPLVLPDLHRDHPKLGLYVREGTSEALIRGLETGALDLLFYPLPVKRAEFEARSLFREPIEVVLSTDHPLAGEPVIDAAMLRGERVLALEPGHKLTDQVRQICEDVGAELSHDYEGTSLDTLRQMVATGIGISLMPALYVKSEVAPNELVVARPFRGTPPARTIGMVWRRGAARTAEYELLAGLMGRALRKSAQEITVLA